MMRYTFWVSALIGIIAHLLLRGTGPLMRVLLPLAPLAAIGLISSLIGIFPMMSLRFMIMWFYCVCAAVVIAEEMSVKDAVRGVFWITFAIMAISILLAIAFPEAGLQSDSRYGNAWRGLFAGKNGFGWMAVWAMLMATLWRYVGNVPALLIAVMASVGIVKSGSQGSLVVAVLALGMMVVTHMLRRSKGSEGVKMLALFVLILLAGAAIVLMFQYMLPLLGRDSTLTGRTDIWRAFIASAMQRPILGAGPGSFTSPSVITLPIFNAFQKYGIILTPHNMFIAMFGEGGMLGLLAMLGLLFYKAVVFPFRVRGNLALVCATSAVIMIVGGMVEAHPIYNVGQGLFYLLFFRSLALRENEEQAIGDDGSDGFMSRAERPLSAHG